MIKDKLFKMKKILIACLLAACFPFLDVAAQSFLDKRVEALINAMTTQEKLEQMYNNLSLIHI